MAQFDVHTNPRPASRAAIPYVLDVQNELLAALGTRVVVPLIRRDRFGTPARKLNPVFAVNGDTVVMSTAELAGIRRSELGPPVASLAMERPAIVAALDLLISGL